ncbi:MAG: putative periplasmic serine endoprotease DegP-like precursor [Verrucomicrobiota bacterium]|jgi:S1-C subfamily serine protease
MTSLRLSLIALVLASCGSQPIANQAQTAAPAAAKPTPSPSPAAAPLAPASAAARLEATCRRLAPIYRAATVALVSPESPGSGSGVIVTPDGIVLTAAHCIEGFGSKNVLLLSDGRKVRTTALGKDRGRDSGMVKIIDPAPPGGWPYVPLAPTPPQGSWVLAMGHPGGVVLGRPAPLRLGRIHSSPEDDFISTDCTVVSGDSGGPLFDLDGHVVGINSNITVHIDANRHIPGSLFIKQWQELQQEPSPDELPPPLVLSPGEDWNQLCSRVEAALKLLSQGGPVDSGHCDQLMSRSRYDARSKRTTLAPEAKRVLELAANCQRQGGRLSRDLLVRGLSVLIRKQDPAAEAMMKSLEKGEAVRFNGSRQALAVIEAAAGIPAWHEKIGIPPYMKSLLTAELQRNSLNGLGRELSPKQLDKLLKSCPYDSSRGSLGFNLEKIMGLGFKPQEAAALLGDNLTLKISDDLRDNGAASLKLLGDQPGRAAKSTLVLKRGVKQIALATAISAERAVTKASLLGGGTGLMATLPDGSAKEIQVIGRDEVGDLALISIKDAQLQPVAWASTTPSLGSWIYSPLAPGSRPALGIVSVEARPIPKALPLVMNVAQRAVIGVRSERNVITEVNPDSAAAVAGLKVGDRIIAVDGKKIVSDQLFGMSLAELPVGTEITLSVKRGEEKLDLKMKMRPAPELPFGDAIGGTDELSKFGGELSQRRSGFPKAIQHDGLVWASSCGGPLVGLDGRCFGINIGRADRICTFALPENEVQAAIGRIEKAKK